MEVAKNSKLRTAAKDPEGSSRSKTHKVSKLSENSNPNISNSSSPLTKSSKSHKYSSKNPVVYSPRNKLRERKFVVAKKNLKKKERPDSNPTAVIDCKCKDKFGGNLKKCLCVAYENLRASQEEFIKKKTETEAEDEAEEKGDSIANQENEDEIETSSQTGSSTIKRRRDKLMEETRNSVSDSGKVMHLVKAFERLLSIPKTEESDKKKTMKWALPGLQPPKVTETIDPSSSSFFPSEFVLTAENLGLGRRFSVSSSWDSSQGSVSSRNSNGGRRSRRNSSESLGRIGGRRWKKQLKQTSQKPFKLRTEQRGKEKEEEFKRKIQEIMVEEEKQRIPIAQGLPWTTDEPEVVLIKPPVREKTIPVDLKLHSDERAVERAEFDHQVAEKISLLEQYKMESMRQQKMVEEEEIKKHRKELIPKAQPMPYFDRPFVPKRSSKNPTIPKEPKFTFHDMSSCTFQGNE